MGEPKHRKIDWADVGLNLIIFIMGAGIIFGILYMFWDGARVDDLQRQCDIARGILENRICYKVDGVIPLEGN